MTPQSRTEVSTTLRHSGESVAESPVVPTARVRRSAREEQEDKITKNVVLTICTAVFLACLWMLASSVLSVLDISGQS